MRKKMLALPVAATLAVLATGTAHAATLVNTLTLPGGAQGLGPVPSGPATDPANPGSNRLGYFSDLYYDRTSNAYYALSDRGPGGGTFQSYQTQVQKFTVDVNQATGAISNFQVQSTITFKDKSGNAFNGLNPSLLNGSTSTLGNSFDPEGFVVGTNGHFFVSDEYGPSVYEFDTGGTLVRKLTPPSNVIPTQANGTANFVDGRPTITSGRQDNRGYEGLAINPSGTKLYGILQDPLVNEGSQNDGRRSRNVRIVEYDVASGQAGRQFIYQLEPIADLNTQVPNNTFNATAQGRNIGASAITAVSDSEFLVLERDNRGVGVDNPTGDVPVAEKRVYKIDITNATDVSGISLADTNTLPAGVNPVAKSSTPVIDMKNTLTGAGQIVPEKMEGLTVGPKLADGSYAILIGTDNDFSVTQTTSTDEQDVFIKIQTAGGQQTVSAFERQPVGHRGRATPTSSSSRASSTPSRARSRATWRRCRCRRRACCSRARWWRWAASAARPDARRLRGRQPRRSTRSK